MGFATRADLLDRTNPRRLALLAVPADLEVLPDEALRTAITGGDPDLDASQAASLAAALSAIDGALADADALIVSYGVPADARTTLLSRLASTIALYNLQGVERMTDEVQKAYDGVVKTLEANARGTLTLVPKVPQPGDESTDDVAVIYSSRPRYGRGCHGHNHDLDDGDDW